MPRILIYSHDTYGMGNLRRTAELCHTLREEVRDATILVITGSPHTDHFRIPESVDIVKLPELKRADRGSYDSRAAGFSTGEVQAIRAEICESVVSRFEPDLVIVDKAPLGVDGELRPALTRLSKERPECVRVLGLRDILDDPEWVRESWERDGTATEILRHYDEVWVFGTPDVFDMRSEYQLPNALKSRISYLGYLGRQEPVRPAAEVRQQLGLGDDPMLLVTVGGGEDGGALIRRVTEILPELRRDEPRLHTFFVSGPRASEDTISRLEEVAENDAKVHSVHSTTEILDLMNAATGIVCMSGYNTACEVLLLRKPAVLVPRSKPVLEQRVRARRLAELGAARWVAPEELPGEALTREIQRVLSGWTPADTTKVAPFSGLSGAAFAARQILEGSDLRAAAEGSAG